MYKLEVFKKLEIIGFRSLILQVLKERTTEFTEIYTPKFGLISQKPHELGGSLRITPLNFNYLT